MLTHHGIKTCWIAKAKRDLGLTRGKASNNKGFKVSPPPEDIERDQNIYQRDND